LFTFSYISNDHYSWVSRCNKVNIILSTGLNMHILFCASNMNVLLIFNEPMLHNVLTTELHYSCFTQCVCCCCVLLLCLHTQTSCCSCPCWPCEGCSWPPSSCRAWSMLCLRMTRVGHQSRGARAALGSSSMANSSIWSCWKQTTGHRSLTCAMGRWGQSSNVDDHQL